jgi:hypothetical protein
VGREKKREEGLRSFRDRPALTVRLCAARCRSLVFYACHADRGVLLHRWGKTADDREAHGYMGYMDTMPTCLLETDGFWVGPRPVRRRDFTECQEGNHGTVRYGMYARREIFTGRDYLIHRK